MVTAPRHAGKESKCSTAPNEPIAPVKMSAFISNAMDVLQDERNEVDRIRKGGTLTKFSSRYIWANIAVRADDGKRYTPSHVKSEVRRYFMLGRHLDKVPLIVLLLGVQAFVNSKYVLELYEDNPNKTLPLYSSPFHMFQCQHWNDNLKTSRKRRMAETGLSERFHSDDALRARYEKKFEKFQRKRAAAWREFVKNHPECAKYAPKINTPTAECKERDAFDFYREKKTSKYSNLNGEQLEQKLRRHFGKLSESKRLLYEEKAQKWNADNNDNFTLSDQSSEESSPSTSTGADAGDLAVQNNNTASRLRDAFDIFKDEKAAKYSYLEGQELEQKLRRHFDRLSEEKLQKYEQKATEERKAMAVHGEEKSREKGKRKGGDDKERQPKKMRLDLDASIDFEDLLAASDDGLQKLLPNLHRHSPQRTSPVTRSQTKINNRKHR